MKLFYTFILLFFISTAYTQEPAVEKPVAINPDSSAKKQTPDTSKKVKIWDPKVAARRSAIIPGWGQIYNKKYWKVPIVYAGLGICGFVFIDNIKTYKEYKFAYAARIKAETGIPADSADYKTLKDIYKVLSPGSIRTARDDFRRYVDYSAIIFILLWGLNVVDATVDAHLKPFDVSPDLSLHFKAGYSDFAKTNGVSLVLTFK